MNDHKELLPTSKVCKELGICRNTLYAWHASGKFIPEQVHEYTKFRKYSREQIDKFKAENGSSRDS